MAEVIHVTLNMKMIKARNKQGDGEESIEDDYDSIESLRDQHQDYVGTEESSNTLGTVRGQQPDPVSPPQWPIRAVVVLLVLLSLTLLAGLLRFAVQHKTISMGRDAEQLLQRLKNVTEQHKTVSMEVEELLQWLMIALEQRNSLLCKQECSGNWTKFGCKCYLISNEMESWKNSRELCVSYGADLVVVDSEEEMDFINIEGKSYWFGATDEASEGLWRWVDGTVLSADNPYWFSGHRDGGKDMNCLMRVFEENTHKWTDESCEESNYALCEYSIIL
ncbi:C-type lectin domain family 4 member C-like [Gadus macrocephalus]|uniref:C-type lectin domain family 4 member C-like n=1 Tax=Gadus macrocephalus TaxID=80720 RepID=UPI0028CB4FA7|nr:C-type lectin domain family 4 member C-like [Gadus macrocephalus]